MLERRYAEGGCEIRTAPSGKPVIAGYAAMFNRWSQDLGGFVEQIDPRAFDKTVREADVRVLFNHDVNWLLGRTSNGTARVAVDSGGLQYEVEVNMKDPDGQRALEKVERRDADGSSFGFRTINQSWNRDATPRERTLLEVSLRDVGPATFPAYLDTPTIARNAVRTLAGELGVEERDVEVAFEAGGFDAVFSERAVWSTAYVNDLPDSAFLYVEEGEKDGEGKTVPRTKRHFPYRDASGKVDLPHLRNALARIPQSNLPQNVKDEATAKARRLLAQHGGEGNAIPVDTYDLSYIVSELAGEHRAGKVLSSASVAAINAAIGQLQELIDNAQGISAAQAEAETDADDMGEGPDDTTEQASADEAEKEERLRSLLLRRYPA